LSHPDTPCILSHSAVVRKKSISPCAFLDDKYRKQLFLSREWRKAFATMCFSASPYPTRILVRHCGGWQKPPIHFRVTHASCVIMHPFRNAHTTLHRRIYPFVQHIVFDTNQFQAISLIVTEYPEHIVFIFLIIKSARYKIFILITLIRSLWYWFFNWFKERINSRYSFSFNRISFHRSLICELIEI